MNPYGYSKHLFDLRAERDGLMEKIAGLKFFNVFGPNEYHKGEMASLVFKGFRRISETGRIGLSKSCRQEYSDGGQARDFVYVKDCTEAMWWLLSQENVNGLFNLGTGVARTWNDLAMALFSAMDRSPKIDYVDMPEGLRDSYQYFSRAEMEKLAKAGCFLKFRSLEEAVKDYVANHLTKENPHY